MQCFYATEDLDADGFYRTMASEKIIRGGLEEVEFGCKTKELVTYKICGALVVINFPGEEKPLIEVIGNRGESRSAKSILQKISGFELRRVNV